MDLSIKIHSLNLKFPSCLYLGIYLQYNICYIDVYTYILNASFKQFRNSWHKTLKLSSCPLHTAAIDICLLYKSDNLL